MMRMCVLDKMRTVRGRALWAALITCGVSVQAQAQEVTNFQLEHFEPLPAQGKNRLAVASTELLPHLGYSFGLMNHYAADQLVVVSASTQLTQARLVSGVLKHELQAAVGLWGRAELDLSLPFVSAQSGDDPSLVGLSGQALSGFSLSDPRLLVRASLLSPENSALPGFGIGAALGVYLPIGDDGAYQSDGAARLEPKLVLDWRHSSGVWVGANIGYQVLRSRPRVRNFVGGDSVRLSGGVELPTGLEPMRIVANILGQVSLSVPTDRRYQDARTNSPAEGQLAVQWLFGESVVAQLGAGAGLNESIGSPAYRVMLGLSYTPLKAPRYDLDQDGVPDRDDQCIDQPEDLDGFMDGDGCPDLDNDADGIVDEIDQCADQAEDRDGFKDDDGCPDPDNDNDGINDDEDRCPTSPGIPALQGCPPQDTDQDGISDDDDLCPEIPEDLDGFEDEDGCPDPDNDGDGVLDQDDQCPLEAGKIERQGCP